MRKWRRLISERVLRTEPIWGTLDDGPDVSILAIKLKLTTTWSIEWE